MEAVFLFKNIQAQGLQVSSGFCVGFPAMTSFTGAAEAFCMKLAQTLKLSTKDFESKGVLVAFENYQFLDCYRKTRKMVKLKENIYEQVVQAFANATLHLAFSVEAKSPEARKALEAGAGQAAAEVLSGMQIAKARLEDVGYPIRLKANEGESLQVAALRALPSQAWVVHDASNLITKIREENRDLLEGLACATLRPNQRPSEWRTFFEDNTETPWKMAAVQIGFMKVDEQGVGRGIRTDAQGNLPKAFVASPTLGLVRFQKAASVRVAVRRGDIVPFWRMFKERPNIWSAVI